MSEKGDALVPQAEGMNEDEVLAFTQGIRQRFVNKLTDGGTKFPEDTKEQYVMLTALGDMDRQALGIKKIGAKERSGAADREAALVIAKVLGQFGSSEPFARPPIEGESRREVPELNTRELPQLELAPGETEIGLSTETYDTFMARMESDKK